MQNQENSLVFVVSVDKLPESGQQKYVLPPFRRELPNYIAFCYNGKLESIHKIEDDQEVFNLIPLYPPEEKQYCCELGPAIPLPKKVSALDEKYEPWPNYCMCFIDLLLTCNSVSEAYAKTQGRRNEKTEQVQYLNMVLVKPLSSGHVPEIGCSFFDVVKKHQKYFCPVGGNYPNEWSNYIAFRYNGKLESIHHTESYKVIHDFQEDFDLPEPQPTGQAYYLFELGPIIPCKEIPVNDKPRYPEINHAAMRKCFIDLLLTCDSIAEAATKTRQGR